MRSSPEPKQLETAQTIPDDGAQAQETLLLEVVGTRYLEYVLNTDVGSIIAHFRGASLDESRLGALLELSQALGRLVPDPDVDPHLRQMQLDALGTFIPASSTSYANTLRVRCGGSIEAGTSTDVVVSCLLPISRDMFPLFLLPAVGPFAPTLARSLFQHPGRTAFDDAVMHDAELRLLFPNGTTPIERSGPFVSNTGRGGSVQLVLFPDLLMRTTWTRLNLGQNQPSLEQFQEGIVATVGQMRDIVMRRQTAVPVRIGLTGVRLPESIQSVPLPWGKLRPASDHDRRAVPSSIIGSLSTTTPAGEQVVIDYSGDIVLEMDLPYRAELREFPMGSEWPDNLRDFNIISRRLESLQLGLLLAVDSKPQPMVVVAWQRLIDPLAQGDGLSWSDTRRTPNLVPYQLTEADVRAWSEWSSDVDERRVKSVEVAIRRTIRAAVERADHSDALVDAVIAWENLVGSREGEPTLRISASLAWLLCEDPAERRTRQTAFKKLYQLRSDVVHGNRSLDSQEALQASLDARSVSVEALRRLFRDRPELLKECRDGAERSLRLMLGEVAAAE